MGRYAGRVALAGVLALSVTACEWAQPRSDAAHTGNNYETAIGVGNVAELEPLWTVDTGTVQPSGPLTVSGAVIVQVGRNVRAYEATSGALRWDVPLPEPPFEGLLRDWDSPSGHGRTVFVGYTNPLTSGGATGGFVTIDARTGAVTDIGGRSGVASTATFAGDDVWYRWATAAPMAQGVFSGIEGRLADGRLMRSVESVPPAPIPPAPPAVAGGVVYAARSVGGFLDAFDAAAVENCRDVGDFRACDPLWSAPIPGHPRPAVSGSTVFAATGTGVSAYATEGVRGPDQQPLWTAEVAGATALALDPAAEATRVFVGSSDGSLKAFDAAGCGSAGPCAPVWQGVTGGSVSSPAVANGLVFVSSDDGSVHAFAVDGCGAATCEPVWSAAVAGAPGSPIVANGRVIVTSSTGEIAVFGLPTSPSVQGP